MAICFHTKCAVVGVLLVALGLVGCVRHRMLVSLLLCLELMFAGANVIVVSAGAATGNPVLFSVAMLVLVIAAVEIAVALGIFVALQKRYRAGKADELMDLKL